MKITIISDEHNGLGHVKRSLFLKEVAEKRGHEVTIVPLTNHSVIYDRVKETKAHWTIINVKWNDELSWLMDLPTRICAIEGQGKFDPDVWIGQAFKGEYHAPDYLILDPRLEEYNDRYSLKYCEKEERWFVYGGGGDISNLAGTFDDFLPHLEADIIWPRSKKRTTNNGHQCWSESLETDTLEIMKTCNRACVASGVVVWELLCLGIPVYTFPASEHQNEFVSMLVGKECLHKYRVGEMPRTPNQFDGFLHRPPRKSGIHIDGKGAERVIRLLE